MIDIIILIILTSILAYIIKSVMKQEYELKEVTNRLVTAKENFNNAYKLRQEGNCTEEEYHKTIDELIATYEECIEVAKKTIV